MLYLLWVRIPPSRIGTWTKAKLEEATGLNSVVLEGAHPSVPTSFVGV